jgi:hypothetical protein
MDGHGITAHCIVTRYVDEGPLVIKKDFAIYAKEPDCIIFKMFSAPQDLKEDIQAMTYWLKKFPTGGDSRKTEEIEGLLKRLCKASNANLIEASGMMDLRAEIETLNWHLGRLYGVNAAYMHSARPSP